MPWAAPKHTVCTHLESSIVPQLADFLYYLMAFIKASGQHRAMAAVFWWQLKQEYFLLKNRAALSAGKMAHSVTVLSPHTWGLEYQQPGKNSRRQTQQAICGFLVSQLSLLRYPWAPVRNPVSIIRGTAPEEWYLMLTSCLHSHSWTWTHINILGSTFQYTLIIHICTMYTHTHISYTPASWIQIHTCIHTHHTQTHMHAN